MAVTLSQPTITALVEWIDSIADCCTDAQKSAANDAKREVFIEKLAGDCPTCPPPGNPPPSP